MVLVPENTLERLQQRQQILTPPITQTLRNLDSEMTDILSSKVLDDEQKAKLYNQVLQRYLSYYDQRKGQSLHVKISTPRAVETPKHLNQKRMNNLRKNLSQKIWKVYPKFTKSELHNCWIKLKSIKMSCIGMIKVSCCMTPNLFQILIW